MCENTHTPDCARCGAQADTDHEGDSRNWCGCWNLSDEQLENVKQGRDAEVPNA